MCPRKYLSERKTLGISLVSLSAFVNPSAAKVAEDPTATTFYREDRFRIVLDKNLPFAGTDLSQQSSDGLGTANAFAKGSENSSHVGIVNLFKFSPATTGNYEYVSECSNRGTCDEGTCACFKGYTDDDCNVQSSLAV